MTSLVKDTCITKTKGGGESDWDRNGIVALEYAQAYRTECKARANRNECDPS